MAGFVFEKLTQSLAANQDWPIGIAANEARVVASSWPVNIELRKNGMVIGVASGVQAGDFIRGVDFDQIRVLNGSTAQSVTVSLASGQAGSDRVVGEVSVISGEMGRVKSGVAYVAAAGQPNSPAVYSYIQLWNPVASGRILVVNQVIGYGAVSGDLTVRHNAVALGALGTDVPANKLVGGGVASVAEVRVGTNAAVQGTTVAGLKSQTANTIMFPMIEPLIVRPGYGILLHSDTVNEWVRGSWQFFEEAI